MISYEIALHSHHKNKISQLFNFNSTLIQPPCRPVAHLCFASFALPSRLAGPIFSHYFTTAYCCCCCYCAFGVILHPVFT